MEEFFRFSISNQITCSTHQTTSSQSGKTKIPALFSQSSTTLGDSAAYERCVTSRAIFSRVRNHLGARMWPVQRRNSDLAAVGEKVRAWLAFEVCDLIDWASGLVACTKPKFFSPLRYNPFRSSLWVVNRNGDFIVVLARWSVVRESVG